MASIRKRTWKSGGEAKTAWVADYFDQAGKRHIKTFSLKKDADAWLATTRHEVKHGIHTPERNSLTVSEAANIWLAQGKAEGLERGTTDKYESHVRLHIAPRIGSVRLANLSAPMVKQFRDSLVSDLSRPMAGKVLRSLKAILATAQEAGYLAQNPAASSRIKRRGRDDAQASIGREIPAKAEVSAILEAATSRWRPLLVAAIFTGLRASELRGLRWEDVDFEQKTIHVRQRADQWGVIGSPKSEAGHRAVPMSPLVVNTLRQWKLVCPRVDATDGKPGRLWLVFPNGAGKPESHANIVNRGFAPIQVAAGVCDPHPTKRRDDGQPVMVARYGMHALRHFFASWAIEQGFTPKKLQALLGHSSIQMTFDTYGHLFPSLEDDHAKFAAGELGIVR